MVETKEKRSILGAVDVVEFMLARHGRVGIGRREDHSEVTALLIVIDR